MNVNFGDRAFEDIIHLSILWWKYPGVGVDPESDDWRSFKGKEKEI